MWPLKFMKTIILMDIKNVRMFKIITFIHSTHTITITYGAPGTIQLKKHSYPHSLVPDVISIPVPLRRDT